MSHNEKVILVTGSSRGIGRGVALELAGQSRGNGVNRHRLSFRQTLPPAGWVAGSRKLRTLDGWCEGRGDSIG